MATEAQRAPAKANLKKATVAAKERKTISKLPKSTRTGLAKQANKVKREKA